MKILSFPEFRQTFEYDCGAKASQAVLAYYGFDVSEEILLEMEETVKTGTSPKDIEKTMKKFGLKVDAGKMEVEQIKKYS